MDIVQALILGVVQGLTEFLPISSSAHLVFMHDLTGLAPNLAFDTLLHVGSLLAVLVYFRKDVLHMIKSFFSSLVDLTRGTFKKGVKEDKYKKLAWLILIGTIPAGLAGFLLEDFFESLFSNLTAVSFFLIITGFLLWGSEIVSQRTLKKTGLKEMTVKNSLIMGVAQACAIAPGISRSGATISSGLFLGLERELAARFSFLLSIPAILGAALVQLNDISTGLDANTGVYVVGFVAAAISGYLAIKIMLKLIKERNLLIFAFYCWIVGASVLIFTLL
ncbi:MAG: undecaprenyl-diphosphatase UppP [Methanomicrobiales archaeon]